MSKKRFTDEELRDAKVPQNELDSSIGKMFNDPFFIQKGRSIVNKQPDIIRLIKQNNKTYENIPAFVKPGFIITIEVNIPFEVGDTITRTIQRTRENPDGIIEEYVIDDCVFHEEDSIVSENFSGNDAYYKMKVHKIVKPKETQGHQINVTGRDQVKVMVGSHDESTNVIVKDSNIVFDKLNQCIQDNNDVSSELKTILLDLSEKMKNTVHTPEFKIHFDSFIQNAASVMNVFAPFIPLLTPLFN